MSGSCANSRTVRRVEIEERVLAGLKDKLMTPEAAAEAMKAYAEETNRLNRERRASGATDRTELAELDRKIKAMLEVIEDGGYARGMMDRMRELEARQDELNERLAAVPADLPDIHPNVAIVYRRKVERLAEALADPRDRDEAADVIRGLIERIVLTPGVKRGQIDAALHGDLGTILEWVGSGSRKGATDTPGSGMSVSVVAGAGLELATFGHQRISNAVADASRDMKVGSDAGGDPCGRLPDGVPRQVRVACRGLYLSVPEKLPNHRQTLPKRQRSAGVRMTQVVKPYILKIRPLPHRLPCVTEIPHVRAPLPASDHPLVAANSRQIGQNPHRRRRQANRSRARLAVGQIQLAPVEIHIRPAQRQDLVPSTSRKQQQSNRGNRVHRRAAFVLRLSKHPAQSTKLLFGQEPLAGVPCTSPRIGMGWLPREAGPTFPPWRTAGTTRPPNGSPSRECPAARSAIP